MAARRCVHNIAARCVAIHACLLQVRPFDDLSASGVNRCCQPCEHTHTRHDGIDALFHVARALAENSDDEISLFRAEIDSAFRSESLHVTATCAVCI